MYLSAPTIRRAAASSSALVRQPMTDEQLIKVAPSIFANEAHDSRSERYTYIPTIEILRKLRGEGYLPFAATQTSCGMKPGRSGCFQRHTASLPQPPKAASSAARTPASSPGR